MELDPRILEVFRELRGELDHHLDEINQNADELSETHEYLAELDMKLEKLCERVDALQALLLSQTQPKKRVRLSLRERSVLQALLSIADPLSSLEVGRRCGLTGDVVAQTLYCLQQKGVPVLAQVVGGCDVYAVDEAFRKENFSF